MSEEAPQGDQTNVCLEAALQYAARGWHVFPWNVAGCWAYEKAENNDNRRWGMTNDAEIIRLYWEMYPGAAVGIATGEESGIFVMETDTKEGGHADDGAASLEELEAEYGQLPETLQAESPSGSVHYYFKHPGFYVTSSAGEIGPGIDLKGDKGMVVGPPSVKPTGVYKWRNDLAVAGAPQWVIDRNQAPKPAPEPEPPYVPPAYEDDGTRSRHEKYAKVVLADRCSRLAAVPPGRRNKELNATAFLLGRLVGAGAISPNVVEAELHDASRANGLVKDTSDRKVRLTTHSELNKGRLIPWIFHDRHTEAKQEEAAGGPKGWPLKHAKHFRINFTKLWIMKGVVAPNEISTWYGNPGTGKSGLVGDLALHISAGRDWRGYRSKLKGSVVYFALERADLVERRFSVQAQQYGLDFRNLPFSIVNYTIDMLDLKCVEKFILTIREAEAEHKTPVRFITIDTSSKAIAAGGGEENAARDKNIVRANARRVMAEIGELHVAFVGHTGKDEKKGERGSNASLGDDDVKIYMDGVNAIIDKRNDGAEGRLTSYKMKPVTLGTDEDGDNIEIAIIDPDTAERTSAHQGKMSPQQTLALELLTNCINDVGIVPPPSLGLPKSVPRVVTHDQWREYCVKGGLALGNEDSVERSFRRVVETLRAFHKIGVGKPYVWLAYV